MPENKRSSTNSLFHYTNYEGIKGIIDCGFMPKFSLEKFDFLDYKSNEVNYDNSGKAFPITCFSDMPVELNLKHREIYGHYAIALKKDWGIENKIVPVWYIPSEFGSQFISKLIFDKNKLQEEYYKAEQKGAVEKTPLFKQDVFKKINTLSTIDNVDKISFLIKPYSGYFKKNGYENSNHKFYDEREWRYIAENSFGRRILTELEFKNTELVKEENLKQKPLNFDFKDIEGIFVKSKEEKIAIENLLASKFGKISKDIVMLWNDRHLINI